MSLFAYITKTEVWNKINTYMYILVIVSTTMYILLSKNDNTTLLTTTWLNWLKLELKSILIFYETLVTGSILSDVSSVQFSDSLTMNVLPGHYALLLRFAAVVHNVTQLLS